MLNSRVHSCFASDAAVSAGARAFFIPLVLDCKGTISSQLDSCIAKWVDNARIEFDFDGRDLCEKQRDKESRRARSDSGVTLLTDLQAHTAWCSAPSWCFARLGGGGVSKCSF